ncbi:hypothetical protein KTO58_21940 [Chitinophaga pendula]|uniref:YncE family protein n=1 Tax=Chitinophaga TaxID=79328 RepID=UPI000BAEA0B7|nr:MULTISPECIES: DUF5074 domain-containing protein [Chitinophaga]ASZ10716.1 hypothetical protein CK934_06850 [Chitinophaga sp. MD30]UCJ06309.1 hypothetical protein KTO58_21940 [Chitinophaga pendula]
MNNNSIKQHAKLLSLFTAAALFVTACSKKDAPIPEPPVVDEGIYILNEGNMGTNSATLDYFDFKQQRLSFNIFTAANPNKTDSLNNRLGNKLGDVGQDVKVYGSKMYIVVNNSNKVEVVDAKTVKSIKTIYLPKKQPRYVAFYKDKAFVNAYDGTVTVIDTGNLSIVKSIKVGKTPEGMTVVGDKLYVANAGWQDVVYAPPGTVGQYDSTLSVIDLNSLTEIKKVVVTKNMGRLVADKYGDIYCVGQDQYAGAVVVAPGDVYVFDTKTETVKKKLGFLATAIAIQDDNGFFINYNWETSKPTYIKFNVATETKISDNFITDGTDKSIKVPYGIVVDPVTSDIYLSDGGVYPTQVYVLSATGTKKNWFKTSGDFASSFAFYRK